MRYLGIMAIALVGLAVCAAIIESQLAEPEQHVEESPRLIVKRPGGVRQEFAVKLAPDGDPIKDGTYVEYRGGRPASVGSFKDDVEVGNRVILYDNGHPFATEQRNDDGLLHGASIKWYKSGVLMSKTQYNEGRQTGAARGYYESGAQRALYQLEGGEPVGPGVQWHENGSVSRITWSMVPGKIILDIQYTKEGTLELVQKYDDEGIVVKFRQGWHANGIRSYEQAYDADGAPHGSWREWDESGRLTKETFYENGKER